MPILVNSARVLRWTMQRSLLASVCIVVLLAVPASARPDLPVAELAGMVLEPPPCSEGVQIDCIHMHSGIGINMNTGEVWVHRVWMFCALYIDAGEYHRGDGCQHTPVEVPVAGTAREVVEQVLEDVV